MSSQKIGIAICTLNQLCLDFEANLNRILLSIDKAIEAGASVRIGPELEVTGYSCEDAFYEADQVFHSWQVLAKILEKGYKNILINIGMPIYKDSSLYNCIVVIYNSKIVYIRAKNRLAVTGNYREYRYFTPWNDGTSGSLAWLELPTMITELTNQTRAPFGDAAILEIRPSSVDPLDLFSTLGGFRIGYEICEELWQPDTQNSRLFGLRGCHLVINSSSSYWELRKLDNSFYHVSSATAKTGGVYAYVNSLGCDGGGRLCFYGRSFVMENGNLLAMTSLHLPDLYEEVEVATVFVDAMNVQQYRMQKNIAIRNCRVNEKIIRFDQSKPDPYLDGPMEGVNVIIMKCSDLFRGHTTTEPLDVRPVDLKLKPEEEIYRYCCLWLWDYLRRSGMRGFILPLSGGLDSASVACIVLCLCTQLIGVSTIGNRLVNETIKPIFDLVANKDATVYDLCRHLLRCVYLRTQYSGNDSYERAKNLATLLGADFRMFDFTHIYQQIIDTVPFRINNKAEEDVTIQQQNVQARIRMLLTYYMSECNRLVLATGNVDEALVGYLTKYDCSSADINPIGSISKNDLKGFLRYCQNMFPELRNVLDSIINATPSAELTGQDQTDEQDMGLTYDELSLFGKVRRGMYGTYGPYGMFCKIWTDRYSSHILHVFPRELDPEFLATKIKRFFSLYARNRHKQTVLTPALHTETYSPDDNRFDHRQFLFNTKWPWQFGQIDRLVEKIKCGEFVVTSLPAVIGDAPGAAGSAAGSSGMILGDDLPSSD